MFKQLGWCVALLILAPAGAEAQQSSIRVSARVVSRVETQRVMAQHVDAQAQGTAATLSVPSSWRWEVREDGSWSAAPVASGRGGEAQSGTMRVAAGEAAGSNLSYVFAPI